MTSEEMTEELDLLAERAADVFCENTRLRAEVKRLELALSRCEKKVAELEEWLERRKGKTNYD